MSGTDGGRNSNTSTLWYVVLALAIIGGSLLRLFGLEVQSLWTDELSSWARSNFYDDIVSVITRGVAPDVHPPGFQILLYYWMGAFGDAPWALRLPAALAGIATIPLVYLLGRAWYARHEGLLAAAFMAVLWCPIYFSQESRAYSLVICFTTVLMLGWHGIVFAGGRPMSLVLFGVAGLALAYLHYAALLLFALAWLSALLLICRQPKRTIGLLIVLVSLTVAYAPWVPYLLAQTSHSSWIEAPTLHDFHVMFKFYLNDSNTIALGFYVLLGVWLALGIFRATTRTAARTGHPLDTPTLVGWIVIPVLALYALSLLATPIYNTRNALVIYPAFVLMFARMVSSISMRPPIAAAVGVFLVALFLAHLVFVKDYYNKPTKEQFREAARIVNLVDDALESSAVVVYCNGQYLGYYLDRIDPPKAVAHDVCGTQQVIRGVDHLAATDIRYAWFVHIHYRPEKELLDLLATRWRLLERVPLIRGAISLYDMRPELENEALASIQGHMMAVTAEVAATTTLRSAGRTTESAKALTLYSETGRRHASLHTSDSGFLYLSDVDRIVEGPTVNVGLRLHDGPLYTESFLSNAVRWYQLHRDGGGEIMRLTSEGNLGLGRSAPSTKLDVGGAVTLHGTVEPATPAPGSVVLFLDETDGRLKVKMPSGEIGVLPLDP